jgi:hypothetical protein
MMLVSAAIRSGEVEPVGGGVVYKIQSDNHSLVETPAHTHRIPAPRPLALTVKYRSLRSNWRSIRHSCKQSQKIRRQVVWK